MIDGIVAIVGKEIILKSDIEKEYANYASHYATMDNVDEAKCEIFERLMTEKLMLNQAEIDSITFTDQQVEDQMNYRISSLLQQVGGDTKILEDYYKKSMDEIKKDLREMLRTQLIVDEVQRNLTQNITIAPSEVKSFYEEIDYDSLPMIQTTYELGHIVRIPPVSDEERNAIKERLEGFRERVLRGEKFSMLARLYSDDPGSASKGGELGFVERGTLYPEFENVAFKLKTGEISNVVQTRAGYHIIQMIERRGDRINVAHILLQPKPSPEEQVKAIEYLDSIRTLILDSKMEFTTASFKFSDDMNKNSGGWLINPYSGSPKFEKESIEPTTYAVVNKLIPGEYSEPVPYVTEDGNMAFRLVYLKSKNEAHKPNLTEDYDVIKNAALDDKKQKSLKKWLVNKVKTTSIKLSDNYTNCDFLKEWKIN
ncbi:MAG: peptidylprolyl isomerase [Bacteroidales bacterium]|nr:peptidylprolyl isomerase [Bacteroidales bacterium]